MTLVDSRISKSRSMDALTSIDYEFEQIDYIGLRAKIENYINILLKLGVLCIDLLGNHAMKSKIVSKFMDSEEMSYTKLGTIINSMFENVYRCEANRIPIHTHINLDSWLKDGTIKYLDDDEYLYQSLVMSRC